MRIQNFVFHVAHLLIILFIIKMTSWNDGENSSMTVAAIGGNETDRLALLAFKAQIIEDPLQVTSSWNDTLHFCQWRGVLCGRKHQRVTQLNLRSQKLRGSISPSIGNLSFVRVLDLANNSFHGKVPREMSSLYRLQVLDLANNSLGGGVAANLSFCSDLRILHLHHNNLTGKIPSDLGFLSRLVKLSLSVNNLEGSIPPTLGNLSSLESLSLAINRLEGHIPASLGQLKSLVYLIIGSNRLSGTIPKSIYNLSRLNLLAVERNQLGGRLPHNIGLTLPIIQIFAIWENQFSGTIPISFANASYLFRFDITKNNYFGGVPNIFGNLQNLRYFLLDSTNLGSGKANDLNFITSLTNCSNLGYLRATSSNLGGILPSSIANFSTQLELLALEGNQISGTIPPGIGNLINLNVLYIHKNQLSGTIPKTIRKLNKLNILYLDDNKFSGKIPSSIGNLTSLTELWLSKNNFQGSIPSTLGKCNKLLLLDLSSNALNGTIPKDVIGLSSLSIYLSLAGNHLTGSLPLEVSNLKMLSQLDVSHNKLSSIIPESLGACTSLVKLYMDHNMFKGTIPNSLASIKGIEEMDLSHNHLFGNIPKDLAKLHFLSKLNLSFNDLEGELPTGGVFSNFSGISVTANNKLCGGIPQLHLVACSKKKLRKHSLFPGGKLILSIIAGVLGICLMLSFLLIIFCFRKKKNQQSSESSWGNPFMNISYGELLRATNGFSLENLIGVGSFGSVYKGILEPDQTSIAVKVFNLERRGASKSFMTECEILRSIRHRNLVKIITACSSIDYQGNDFKALVYDFMLNGSLQNWLHPHPQQQTENQHYLTLSQRISIAIDVASAVDYLHNHGETPILHCDIKPSNILLDQEFTAHVGDFGLSRIMAEDNAQTSHVDTSSIGIKGTIGYAAPEYGMGSKVSTEGDVYSFGILLLEMFTGKKPTESSSEDHEMNLTQFVKMALPERVMEIVDQGIVPIREGDARAIGLTRNIKIYDCFISFLEIGILCSTESPRERMKIRDALKELHVLKNYALLNT